MQRFLDELSVEYVWMPGNGPVELGLHEIETMATFAIPLFGNPKAPFLVSPGFGLNLWNGPSPPARKMLRLYWKSTYDGNCGRPGVGRASSGQLPGHRPREIRETGVFGKVQEAASLSDRPRLCKISFAHAPQAFVRWNPLM